MEERYIKAKEIVKKYNQEHLLSQYNKLDNENKEKLLNQILNINFEQINKLYNQTKEEIKLGEDKIEPIKYIDKETLSIEEKNYYSELGIKEIKDGKLGVVTMAGGQGTRLRT